MRKKAISFLLVITILLHLAPALLSNADASGLYNDADWENLLDRYQKFFAGDDSVDWTDAEIQRIVGATNSAGITTSGISYKGGTYWLDLEKNRANPLRIFGNVDITPAVSSASMGYQFEKLRDMALAYATKGAVYHYKDSNGTLLSLQLYKNEDLRDAIFYGLKKGHEAFYHYESYKAWCSSPYAGMNENWYDWATTAPEAILKALVFVSPALDSEEQQICNDIVVECLAFLNRIRPNNTGKYDVDTLANRRSRVRIGPFISLFMKDTALMEECRTNLQYFMKTDYTSVDGIKPDGSYIYHNNWALEGMYGTGSLIEVLFSHFSVMSGTAFAFGEAQVLVGWIMNTFRPVTHKGTILSAHCGRSPQNGNLQGVALLKGALQLIGCTDPASDLQLKQFIRSMVCEETAADTQKSYASFAVNLADVNLVSVLKKIVIDSDIPADEREYAAVRYCADRIVQHQNDYTVGISMSSNRIAIPESINGCNRYGWYAGDGMLYVYNDRTQYNINQYGFEFWRHANMYRLPGITQEDSTLRQPWSNAKPYFPGMTYHYDASTKTESWTKDQNELGQEIASFVGGAELGGKYIAAAMDFESYSWSEEEVSAELLSVKTSSENNKRKQQLESDLTAKKSYFLFDNEIVCVGSDIDFSTRDSVVNTYVDNRELYKISKINGASVRGTEDILVDGELLEKVQSFDKPYHYTDPTWVHEQNFGGYYFPAGGEVYVNKTYRESSDDGDNTNDDFNNYLLTTTNPPTAKYSAFELWLSHGTKPQDETYSYVMLPEMSVDETKSYTENPDIRVLKCTDTLHVVKEETLGITAMVFWTAGTYGDITVDQPLILMVQEKNGKYLLSACDPTHNLNSATITINRSLHTTSADEEITIEGRKKTVLHLQLDQCGGKTVSAEFSTASGTALMFDFASEARHQNSVYGFYDYTDANYWATEDLSSASVSIANGAMSFPLTTQVNSAGENIVWTFIEPSDSNKNFAWSANPNRANVLNFDPSNADIFQVRLKLTDVTVTKGGAAGIYLCYLPEGASCWSNHETIATNPYRETIGAGIPDSAGDGGALDGKYLTLTVSLKDKKLPTYDLIKGISISFGNLRGGKATIDYIYIGPETESLYFGFDNDGGTDRYEEAAYGGYDFDRNEQIQWATNLTESVGGYMTVDHAEGILSLYTQRDAYGESGAYLCTTAVSGQYAWSNLSNLHSLSYDPEQAEVLEIRFRTNNLVKENGQKPTLVLIAVLEKDGVITSDTACQAGFTIQDGAYQTVRIPLNAAIRSADYVKSIGVRFVGTGSGSDNAIGRIDVDYIYMGAVKHCPSHLYFDFTNTKADRERYSTAAYGNNQYDTGNWAVNTARNTKPVYGSNTLSITIAETIDHYSATGVSPFIQTTDRSGALANTALNYIPKNDDFVQVRFAMRDCAVNPGLNPAVCFYFANESSGGLAGSVTSNLAVSDLTSGKYVVVTIPLKDVAAYTQAEKITSIRLSFPNVHSLEGKTGVITLDYLFVGIESALPIARYTVTFKNADGTVLGTQVVHKGESAAYAGPSPTKAYDSSFHYSFKGWDKALTNITANTTVTAQFTATAHSYSYSKTDNTNHRCTCTCGYSKEEAHTWNAGSVTTEPTCTVSGVKTYTCAVCKATRTEAVSAKGHTVVIDKAVAATCTTAGKTEGSHCSLCSAVIIAQQTVPATGHTLIYTNTSTLEHSLSCKSCDYSKTEAHSFTNGSCICGEPEIREAVESDGLKLYHSLNLASDISVNYMISASVLEGFDMNTVYLTCKYREYDGNAETEELTVTLQPTLRDGYYRFTLTGLTSVHMGNRLQAVLYGTKDRQPYYSATDDYSIGDYAYSQLNKSDTSVELKTLCADLLRYGAAAQTYKGYRTDSLVDAAMTDAHRSYLSDLDPIAFGNHNIVGTELANPTIKWVGKALDLNTKVALLYIIDTGSYIGNPKELTIRVTYTNLRGEEVTTTLTDPTLYANREDYYCYRFDGLTAAELRTVLTATVYEGETPISNSLTYSPDTYGNNKTGTMATLCKALIAYSDSAKAYFLS